MNLFRSPQFRRSRSRLVYVVVTVLILLSPLQSAFAAPSVEPASTEDAVVCAQAQSLTDAGYPQRAVALVDSLNAALPEAAARLCSAERASAFARMSGGERLALLASSLTDVQSFTIPAGGVDPVTCVLTGTASPEPTAANVLGLALNCDRENARALALNATLPAKETPPPSSSQRVQKSWAEFAAATIAPLQEIGMALLLWLLVSLVFLSFMPFVMRNRALPRIAERGQGRLVGMALVLAGAVLGTFGAASGGGTTLLVGGLLLTGMGAALWDSVRRSQVKLLVTVEGDQSENAASNLRGIIADMGAALPKGVEVPIGPDTTFLTEVDFTFFGAQAFTNAIKTILLALKPYAPWRLAVNCISDDRLAVTLRRNYEQISSQIVDRTSLRLDSASMASLAEPNAKKDDNPLPSLWPFAAALTVVQMASLHNTIGALAGATNWRAVAYHFIATTQLRGQPTAEKAILGRAVDLDPGNTAAAIAFWNALYRDSGDPKELSTYVSLLDTVPMRLGAITEMRMSQPDYTQLRREVEQTLNNLDSVVEPHPDSTLVEARERLSTVHARIEGGVAWLALEDMRDLATSLARVRSTLLSTRTAIEAYLLAQTEPPVENSQRMIHIIMNLERLHTAIEAERRLEMALALIQSPLTQAGPEAVALQIRAKFSKLATLVNLGYLSVGDYHSICVERDALLEALEPIMKDHQHAVHELAVTMAPRVLSMNESIKHLEHLPGNVPTVQDAVVGGPQMHYLAACRTIPWAGNLSEQDAKEAVKHLEIADLDDGLKAFRSTDPQLDSLREHPEYRARFNKKVETDLLTIQPFTGYAKILRETGLITAQLLADAEVQFLKCLGVPLAVAHRMLDVARLALAIDAKNLHNWQVPITSYLEETNRLKLEPALEKVSVALEKELHGLASQPRDEELARLWES